MYPSFNQLALFERTHENENISLEFNREKKQVIKQFTAFK